jgi:hypothetical protein
MRYIRQKNEIRENINDTKMTTPFFTPSMHGNCYILANIVLDTRIKYEQVRDTLFIILHSLNLSRKDVKLIFNMYKTVGGPATHNVSIYAPESVPYEASIDLTAAFTQVMLPYTVKVKS